MKKSINGGLLAGFLVLLSALPTVRLSAQAVLNQFSYDELRPSGLQFDIGLLGASQLQGAPVGGIRLDYGFIAPKVRLLFGLSYTKAQLDRKTRDRFVQRLRGLITDPTSDYTINIGRIDWGDIIADMDFQYAIPQGPTVTTYIGAGLGIHLRNGSGTAIAGTFVEDALDEVAAAGNITLGVEVKIADALRVAIDSRGVLSTGLSTISLRSGLMYRWAKPR